MKYNFILGSIGIFSAVLWSSYYFDSVKPSTTVSLPEKTTLVVKEELPKEAQPTLTDSTRAAILIKKLESKDKPTKPMIRTADLDVFSENVRNVRDKISLGIAPERDELISAMREVYKDRPESFKRNLERSFDKVLNPKPYCNDMRKTWSDPYISEINEGFAFINEDRWNKNSPTNKVQLAQYLSKCTQDGQPIELVSTESGNTIAYYSIAEGYQSNY